MIPLHIQNTGRFESSRIRIEDQRQIVYVESVLRQDPLLQGHLQMHGNVEVERIHPTDELLGSRIIVLIDLKLGRDHDLPLFTRDRIYAIIRRRIDTCIRHLRKVRERPSGVHRAIERPHREGQLGSCQNLLYIRGPSGHIVRLATFHHRLELRGTLPLSYLHVHRVLRGRYDPDHTVLRLRARHALIEHEVLKLHLSRVNRIHGLLHNIEVEVHHFAASGPRVRRGHRDTDLSLPGMHLVVTRHDHQVRIRHSRL